MVGNSVGLNEGDRVERYVVESVLGRGGMAVVFLVRHTTLDTRHALKVLTTTSPVIRERLVQEGRVQAALRHPNVVAVTDVLDIGGQPALLLEYVEGPTLAQWLAAKHPALPDALRVFRGVLEGVGAAHAIGVVHRDLKPSNVLLARSKGEIVPKVADFGLAKALADTGGVGLTQSGATMGTPAYMAPEQARSTRHVDHRADVFALGCILYEMVCAVPAFDGADVVEIISAVCAGRYVPPGERVPGLPEAVDRAIRGCLEVSPSRRIPDCATLGAVLAGAPWDVPAASSVSETPAWPTRWSGGAGLSTLPAAGSGVTYSSPDAEAPTPVAPPSRTGFRFLAVAVALSLGGAGGLWYALGPESTEGLPLPVDTVPDQALENVPTASVPDESPTIPVVADPSAAPLTAELPVVGVGGGVPPGPLPPPRPARAMVRVKGADSLRIVGAGGTYGPGPVPTGVYLIQALFAEGPVDLGTRTLTAGQEITFTCDALWQTCRE